MSKIADLSFVDLCAAGKARADDIDDYVDDWHANPRGRELHAFLGLNRDQYALWVRRPDAIDEIIKERRGQSVSDTGLSTLSADSTTVEVNRHPVESSAVRSLGYQPDMEILEVEYQNGRVYRYYGVPQAVYDELMGGGSIGEFVNYIIKPNHRYKEIADAFARSR